MSTSTINVGSGAVTIYGANAAAGAIQIINLDTANTVYLGGAANISPGDGISIPLGPLASIGMDGTAAIYAVTAGPVVTVALVPGGTAYSPGSLTITGPVTAEITGPVEVDGTVAISGTPTVDLAAGATVDISGTAAVSVQNASIDVIGGGGYILPGQVTSLFSSPSATSVAANSVVELVAPVSCMGYSALDVVVDLTAVTGMSPPPTTVQCAIPVQFVFFDPSGQIVGIETVSCPMLGKIIVQVPVRAETLYVQVFNTNGSAFTIPASSVFITGTYRTVTKKRIISYSSGYTGTVNSVTFRNGTASAYAQAEENIADLYDSSPVTSGLSAYWLRGYYGPVTGWARVTGGTSTTAIGIWRPSALKFGSVAGGLGASGLIQELPPTAGTITELSFNAPAEPLLIVCSFNSGTTAFQVYLTGAE